MTRSTLLTLAVLIAAAVVASQLGGRVGMGVVAGALCGCGVSLLGAAWMRHVFKTRPKLAMNAFVETFLFKLAFVAIGVVSFRYIPAAYARVDWQSFLVAFAVCVLFVHTLAVSENVKLLGPSGGASGSDELEDRGPVSPSMPRGTNQ